MRRVFGIFLIWPLLCFSQQGQYDDTIQGKITINYNQPMRMKVSVLAGGAFETQGLEGSVFLPAAFADVHIRPSKWVSFHGALSQQFQLGWQYQKIKDTRNLEVGTRIFFASRVIDKIKTFTAGTRFWKYDFNFPVKVLWNFGLSGSFRYGTAVFNSGLDPNTAIRFRDIETQKVVFLNQAAVPYTFSQVSAGFVLNTSSNMKVTAHLPAGQTRVKRMKTFTEFRAEMVYGTSYKVASTVSLKPSDDAYHNINYDVMVNRTSNWGFKLQGIFRRKWAGLKLEAGVRPGVYYRFSGSEQPSILDRSYIMLGLGFGWM